MESTAKQRLLRQNIDEIHKMKTKYTKYFFVLVFVVYSPCEKVIFFAPNVEIFSPLAPIAESRLGKMGEPTSSIFFV